MVSDNSQVFVNCPFDEGYQPIFNAIIFTLLSCGFAPRCAKERDDSGEVRVEKIKRIIKECGLGIHDLSRVEVGASGVPRFNMPLELGIFIGCREYGGKAHKQKQLLVLDSHPHRYQASTSDISGQDIRVHNGLPADAIRCVRDWLSSKQEGRHLPGGSLIAKKYEQFILDLPTTCELQGLDKDEITYLEFLSLISIWLGR